MTRRVTTQIGVVLVIGWNCVWLSGIASGLVNRLLVGELTFLFSRVACATVRVIKFHSHVFELCSDLLVRYGKIVGFWHKMNGIHYCKILTSVVLTWDLKKYCIRCRWNDGHTNTCEAHLPLHKNLIVNKQNLHFTLTNNNKITFGVIQH